MTKHRPGGLPAAEFLRRYWQKAPLLVRRALVWLADRWRVRPHARPDRESAYWLYQW